MAVADINSLIRPLQSDLVGERGERDYEKPEEKDHFFKWLGQTDLAQSAKNNLVNFFSQERQLESDTGKKIAGSWANIMKALRIDEEDSSGKLLKELQEMEDRGEQSWKALLAYPALGEKLLQKVTGFMIPESSVKAAEKMASGEKYTKGEALMAAAPVLEFIPGTTMIPYGKIAKGVATAADELGTAATYFPQYTPFKKIEPKSVGAKSVDESGNVKTTMGPAPKNLKPAADKWLQDNPGEPNATAMDVFLNEPDKYLKTGIVNIGNIKDRRIALGISTPEGKNINKLSAKRKENTFTDFKSNLENVDMNDPQAVLNAFRSSYKKGYAETEAAKQYEKTGSLAKSESANSQINELIDQFENTEGGFKILKQKEINKLKPKKKDTSDIYAEYYRKEFSPNTAVINVKKSSEFRFFNNKRRTLDDQTPQEFFSQYSLKDIEKGGKFHNEYLQFKAIDDVRIKNVENLQPILRKIFTKVRESIPNLRPNKKKSLVNLNIAHKFESSGIKRGYVSETKTGKGTDPTEIYIDVSEYNQTIQPSLEAEARKLYKKYIESGDEAARKEYLKIDKDMKILGIEGQVAPGQTVGKAMPFDDKIRQIADEAIDNNFITQKEYDQLINSAEEIAESKIKFFDTFGIKTTYAGGGIVGIDRMTRSLREF